MAGSLILIDKENITSAVSSVTLTGITSDYDVYTLIVSGYEHDTQQSLYIRVTNSGTARDSANYEYAHDYRKSDTTSTTFYDTSATAIPITATVGNASADEAFAEVFLFNFSNASEYSQINVDSVYSSTTAVPYALTGSGAYMVAEANDGVHLYGNNSATFTGNFELYALKK